MFLSFRPKNLSLGYFSLVVILGIIVFLIFHLSNKRKAETSIFKILFSIISIAVILIYITLPSFHKCSPWYELSAIGTLRTLSTSQNQFKNSCLKDRDGDGIGEYGFFTELSGLTPIPKGTKPSISAQSAFLSRIFGKSSLENHGIVKRNGYYFLIYLPGGKAPIAESGQEVKPLKSLPPKKQTENEINAQENRWVAYAWPAAINKRCACFSASSAFFISQKAQLLKTSNFSERILKKRHSGKSSKLTSNMLYYKGKTNIPQANDVFENNNGNLEGSFSLNITNRKTDLVWYLLWRGK